jgi:hypothetical protein
VGLWQLLCELFGMTDDNSKYVYLSDGGHFDNLGIYELLKRRCKYVIACDAGADPKYSLDDLGSAIRKCREDIGVEIELNTKPVVLIADSDKNGSSGDDKNGGNGDNKSGGKNPDGSGKKWSKWHCVVGEIRYDMVDPLPPKKNSEEKEGEAERRKAINGVFVYVKASLTGEEPGDVLNYQTSNQDFPHQSTVDQWFSESQFESYRRLGQHIVEAMLDPLADDGGEKSPSTLHEDALKLVPGLPTKILFEKLQERWTPPADPPGGNRPKPPGGNPTTPATKRRKNSAND